VGRSTTGSLISGAADVRSPIGNRQSAMFLSQINAKRGLVILISFRSLHLNCHTQSAPSQKIKTQRCQ
ncbi:MAG TPA: hypothetical protein VLA93_01895, partial [Pyrinomonadaceae bacterium]|nr:hypothetical protein [Pyrinomonadaceae bacterium]